MDAISDEIMLHNLFCFYTNQRDQILIEDMDFMEYVSLENNDESVKNKLTEEYYSDLLEEYDLVSLAGDIVPDIENYKNLSTNFPNNLFYLLLF